MTWYFVPHPENRMDIYDHTGTLVEEGREFETWQGGYPDEVLVVMRENMEGSQPSAYNQSLLADAATDNIKQGTPPK